MRAGGKPQSYVGGTKDCFRDVIEGLVRKLPLLPAEKIMAHVGITVDVALGEVGRQVITKTSNRKRSITVKVWVVARQMRQSFHETVERSGVTRAQWTLIAAVASRPGATQRVLAELLQVREITVGRLITRLCSEGYLTRSAHPNDGRAYCVDITPAARPLLDSLDRLAKVHEAVLFAGFDEDELSRLSELLDTMEHNLSAARLRCDDKNRGEPAE